MHQRDLQALFEYLVGDLAQYGEVIIYHLPKPAPIVWIDGPTGSDRDSNLGGHRHRNYSSRWQFDCLAYR